MFLVFLYVLSAGLTLKTHHPVFATFLVVILSAFRGVYMEAMAGVFGCYFATTLKEVEDPYTWIGITGGVYWLITYIFTQSIDQAIFIGLVFAVISHAVNRPGYNVEQKPEESSPDGTPPGNPLLKST